MCFIFIEDEYCRIFHIVMILPGIEKIYRIPEVFPQIVGDKRFSPVAIRPAY